MKPYEFLALSLLALVPLIAPQAAAQATRTWVSGVGDDANPCSRTAPCKTFAGAISKTAAGGEIDALDPGGFGAVTITKSITISGDGTMAGVLVSGTNGIVVNAGSSDVVILRDLVLDGLVDTGGAGLNGINFLSGGELHVESLKIFGFGQDAILFQPSGASTLFVTNTSLRNNGGGGIHVLPGLSGTAIASVDHVSMEGNSFGLRAEDGSRVVARDASASGNGSNGFAAAGTFRAADLTLESCITMFNNQAGVLSGPLSTVKMSNVVSSKNNFGIQSVSGGALISFGNNKVFGNVTSDGAPSSTISPM